MSALDPHATCHSAARARRSSARALLRVAVGGSQTAPRAMPRARDSCEGGPRCGCGLQRTLYPGGRSPQGATFASMALGLTAMGWVLQQSKITALEDHSAVRCDVRSHAHGLARQRFLETICTGSRLFFRSPLEIHATLDTLARLSSLHETALSCSILQQLYSRIDYSCNCVCIVVIIRNMCVRHRAPEIKKFGSSHFRSRFLGPSRHEAASRRQCGQECATTICVR